MKLKLKHVSFGLFALLLLLSVGYHWLVPKGIQQAPEVSFNIVDGRTLSLSQLTGRPVLVVFWATTCESCIKEIPHLIDLYKELAPRGLEIIAVAMAYDPPNQVMEMRQRIPIPYPIAIDVQGKIAQAFAEVRLTPTTFLIDPQGQVVIQKTGLLDMKEMRSKLQSMLPASTGG
jgi:thiol-disulfide isomerase/thioredoxin